MIDWALTKSKFNLTSITGYRPKIVVRCDICGDQYDYVVRVKSRIVDNDMEWQCIKCVNRMSDVRNKHSQIQVSKWADQEYRSLRSHSSKERWSDNRYRSKHKKSVTSLESRQKCSKAAIEAWKDEDYRKKHAAALVLQSTRIPNTEHRMIAILDKLGIAYEHQFIVGPYTFDFMIERGDLPRLLLEINGNYHHSKDKVIQKDNAKASYIQNFGQYELRTIWEHQLFDYNKIKNLLNRWIGNNVDTIKVNLRDLEIREVAYDNIRDLICNFHYIGNVGRKGLYFGGFLDDIICGAVFSHPIRKEVYHKFCSKHEALELSRFVISPFYHNKNLASYFLSRCVKLIPSHIRYLFSFSDPSAGHIGTIYRACNWVSCASCPSYFYVSDDGWCLHKKTLYNQAKGVHMSEAEFAHKFGYRKVNTPPKIKFYLRLR